LVNSHRSAFPNEKQLQQVGFILYHLVEGEKDLLKQVLFGDPKTSYRGNMRICLKTCGE
jgi:hypothetical protein